MDRRGRILSSRDAARAVPLRFGVVGSEPVASAEPEANLEERLEEQRLRLELERGQWLASQQDSLVELGRALAERLLGAALRLEPAVIVELAREVLREAAGARQLLLYGSPRDHAALLAARAELSETFQVSLELVIEPSLKDGDLWLESKLGHTDARLSTRLEHLLQLLRRGARA